MPTVTTDLFKVDAPSELDKSEWIVISYDLTKTTKFDFDEKLAAKWIFHKNFIQVSSLGKPTQVGGFGYGLNARPDTLDVELHDATPNQAPAHAPEDLKVVFVSKDFFVAVKADGGISRLGRRKAT